ncbi:MAG: bifunctional DNA-formamidopyrimidine glycosylase/DNA-(apurinic or apyrimidinic site) lyase [bacterium]
MPELPEVETIVRDLQKKIIKKQIVKIQVHLPKIIKGSIQKFISTLQNNKFIKVQRRAKFLIFTLASGQLVLIHLRMTGQLIYQAESNKEILGKLVAGGHGQKKDLINLPNKHTHLIINFIDGCQLFYNDLRQFGFIQLIKSEQLNHELRNFGQEPLESRFTLAVFQKMFSNRKGNIKAFLLNQKYVVGLGNIYVDEVLFSAKVLPSRKINSLSNTEIKNIYFGIKNILRRAVKYRGTTFNDYRDASGKRGNFLSKLKVYSRTGQKCLRCKQGIIQKQKIAGRGTSYCSHCQS